MLSASAAAGAPLSGQDSGAPSGSSAPGEDGADGATTTTSANDNKPPVITINGANPAHINVGDTYADPGAQITAPAADKNLGITTLLDGATTTSIQLDTTKSGTHSILYTVTDPKGFTGSATRTVIVSAAANDNTATTTPPVAANDNILVETASSTAANE